VEYSPSGGLKTSRDVPARRLRGEGREVEWRPGGAGRGRGKGEEARAALRLACPCRSFIPPRFSYLPPLLAVLAQSRHISLPYSA
jgi:hypothetical protein